MKPIVKFLSQITNTEHQNLYQIQCVQMTDDELVADFNRVVASNSPEFCIPAKELFNRKYHQFNNSVNDMHSLADMLAVFFNCLVRR